MQWGQDRTKLFEKMWCHFMKASAISPKSGDIYSPLVFAVFSSAAFGFGPIAVRYLHKIVNLGTFMASVKTTTIYFLAVYLVVYLLSYGKRSLHFSIPKLLSQLSLKTNVYLVVAGISNAVSGWCFFTMLGRIDALSSSMIMALALVLSFILSKFVLGEDISFKSSTGKRKWKSLTLVIAGALIAAVYSYSSTITQTKVNKVTLGILAIAFLSSVFAAIRTIAIKRVISDYQKTSLGKGANFDLPLTITRASYLLAFLLTLMVGIARCLINPSLSLDINEVLLLHPFVIILGLIYGVAYSMRYIAMTSLEASRLILISRLSSVFTGFYMLIGGAFGVGQYPSWIQAPAATLVVLGSYLAARVEKRTKTLPG